MSDSDSVKLPEVLGRVSNEPAMFLFWCPGCELSHWLDANRWTWDGDLVKPTASPSFLVNANAENYNDYPRCHFFIRNGQFQYCGDSTHALKGQTVNMVPWDNQDGP